MDLEHRAYCATLSIQGWLSVRLDLFVNVLVLGISLFAAGFRFKVNPSRIGVVLAYTLSGLYTIDFVLLRHSPLHFPVTQSFCTSWVDSD